MKQKTASKEAKIEGYLEEVELENGDTGLQLEHEERAYLIEMDGQGRKLLRYADEEVELVGRVTQNGDVYKIKVASYEVLDAFDDEDEETDYEDDDDDDDFMSDRYDD